MNQKLCLLICFFVGVLVFYLLKNTCGCKVVEGNPSCNWDGTTSGGTQQKCARWSAGEHTCNMKSSIGCTWGELQEVGDKADPNQGCCIG